MKQNFVSLSVNEMTPDNVTRVVEVLSRAAAGLALEGIDVNISFGSFDLDEDEEGTGA
jgi:hypothetical protein